MRAVARRFRVSLATVQAWHSRAAGRALDDVDWSGRSSAPKRTGRVTPGIEERVLRVRKLLAKSALGEYGAVAIHRYLLEHHTSAPSVRTIGRILRRRGALDGRARVRRPPPPLGWYLPDVARREVELDSFDIVEGLVIARRSEVQVFNAISLHGGLVGSWPTLGVTARNTVEFLVEHWRRHGLPRYAQFDNDARFYGAHHFSDSFGRVTRLCLSLGVVPVFAPPRETGFQAAVESYNGRWQAKVWTRFLHRSLIGLKNKSAAYVTALHARLAARIEAAPPRRTFPENWQLDLNAPLNGRVVLLRRTDEEGIVDVFGHRIRADTHWAHRLVRAEVDFDRQLIAIYALRRREPDRQHLLQSVPYSPQKRRFRKAR